MIQNVRSEHFEPPADSSWIRSTKGPFLINGFLKQIIHSKTQTVLFGWLLLDAFSSAFLVTLWNSDSELWMKNLNQTIWLIQTFCSDRPPSSLSGMLNQIREMFESRSTWSAWIQWIQSIALVYAHWPSMTTMTTTNWVMTFRKQKKGLLFSCMLTQLYPTEILNV